MSVLCVCIIATCIQTSEKVCFLDVSTNLVLVYSVCGYCPYGTSEYVLGQKHQVFYVQTSENVWLYVFEYSVHYSFMYGFVLNSQKWENVWDLAQTALPTKTDVFCLAYNQILSIGFCRQFSCGVNLYRFPSLLSPKSFLLLFYLLLYLL